MLWRYKCLILRGAIVGEAQQISGL